ncbi:hypothetical protein F4780DRAFT_746457 [Xylariomycetidae sp. FL0641]|nr:hypothetical protein F4780DRAFT_746457 [Xylariomycetidae sp. FL0641]
MTFNVVYIDEKKVDDVEFAVQFQQIAPLTVFYVDGAGCVLKAHGVAGTMGDGGAGLERDLVELETMKQQFWELEQSIALKMQQISDTYGFQRPDRPTPIQDCDGLRCVLRAVYGRVRGGVSDMANNFYMGEGGFGSPRHGPPHWPFPHGRGGKHGKAPFIQPHDNHTHGDPKFPPPPPFHHRPPPPPHHGHGERPFPPPESHWPPHHDNGMRPPPPPPEGPPPHHGHGMRPPPPPGPEETHDSAERRPSPMEDRPPPPGPPPPGLDDFDLSGLDGPEATPADAEIGETEHPVLFEDGHPPPPPPPHGEGRHGKHHPPPPGGPPTISTVPLFRVLASVVVLALLISALCTRCFTTARAHRENAEDEEKEAMLQQVHGSDSDEEDDVPTTMEQEIAQFRRAANIVDEMVSAEEGRIRESAPQMMQQYTLPVPPSPTSAFPDYAMVDEALPAYAEGDFDPLDVADGFRGSSAYSPSEGSATGSSLDENLGRKD